MNEGKQTFRDLLVGIIIFGVIFVLIGIIWTGSKLEYYLGLAIGFVVAVAMVYDIYLSLQKGLTMEGNRANHYFRKKVVIRLGFILIILLVALFVDNIQLLSVLFGILTLKFSAYLQPLTHKLFKNN